LDVGERKYQEDGEDYIMRSFIICNFYQIFLTRPHSGRWVGRGMRNAYRILFRESERTRPRGRLGTDGRIILKWILKYGVRVWIGFIRIRMEFSCERGNKP
jgi:hypothetical protein